MSWIIIAIGEPFFHGLANILDSFLTNKLFRNVWTLTFWSTLFHVLFLPLVFFLGWPTLPPLRLVPVIVLIGLIEVVYLFPYYAALRSEDTSVDVALFDLGKLFVPILAFVLVKEKLHTTQYLGFLLIIASSVCLTLHHRGRLARGKWYLNRAFWYMGLVSVLLSLEDVLYKYLFIEVGWNAIFVWTTICSFIFASILMLCWPGRKTIRPKIKFTLNGGAKVFVAGELSTFAGEVASTYAIALAPVTLVAGISSVQPFFVLVYAMVFHKLFPRFFKERVNAGSIIKKAVFFVAILAGVALIVSY